MEKPTIAARVLRGSQLGRTIGFPTLNLDPSLFPKGMRQGVYAAQVEILGHAYAGALYFGPRKVLDEETNVLEIHVLDFHQDVYGQTIHCMVEQFIRGVMNFACFEDLQTQLHQDVHDVKSVTSTISQK